MSVSQQNSPRRSLIPQPTRQRSTSLTKSTERLSSPRLGRRADSRARLHTTDSRNRLNASGNSSSATNLAARRQVSRTPSKLSPIQGTPTKPERTSQFAKRDRSKETAKQQKFAASPSSRNTWTAKKQSQERVTGAGKTQSKERVTSPSKIPLKTNRVSSNVLNPARFINISNSQANGRSKKAGDKGSKEAGGASSNEQATESGSKQSDSGTSKGSQASDKGSNTERSSAADLHLIDLLKQTSAATGTSSVVNTTATTAVQPLHIDANAPVLLDAEVSEKTKSQQDLSNSKSSNTPSDDTAAKQTQSFQVVGNEDHRQTNPPISKSSKPNGGRTKVGGTESRNNSPVPTENVSSHSKSNSISQSIKSVGKVSNAASNAGSATQRSNRIVQNAMINDQNAKNCRPTDQKIEESSTVQPASTNVQSSSTKTNEGSLEPASDPTRNLSSTDAQRTAVSGASASVKQEDPARTIPRSTNNSETTKVVATAKSTSDQSTIASSRASNNVSNVAGAVSNDSRNANNTRENAKARADNHGSGTSVKSSARVSVDSIESVRSTDTGVSVDTVKGVSSPREKTGMHVVKRPQEIETLSGNVMYLEQNGEPA